MKNRRAICSKSYSYSSITPMEIRAPYQPERKRVVDDTMFLSPECVIVTETPDGVDKKDCYISLGRIRAPREDTGLYLPGSDIGILSGGCVTADSFLSTTLGCFTKYQILNSLIINMI